MSKKEICLVTGATGAVGPSLIRHLVEEGYQVRVLTRPESDVRLLPEGITRIIGDINNQGVIARAVSDVDYVFHLAAILHINNPDASLIKEYNYVNVDGTKTIVDASVAANVKRVIFFSTINVYGSGGAGQEFFENSLIDPQTLYTITKAKAEEIVLSARLVSDEKPLGVVLRLAAIYGPGMKGNYVSLLKGLKQGWFIPIGLGKNRRTLIYVDDAIRAAAIAASHPEAAGNIYNLTDGRVYSLMDIIHAMCGALGRRSPRVHLPIALVNYSVGLIEDVFRLLGQRSPIGRQTIGAMLEDRAVNGDKIQQELGFNPKIELEEGWRKVVDEIYKQAQ
ncbi:MAG: NAD-dependent epimerase/dehydratase family protein [Anaerolineales bacterium]|nr:NAD-dependent epimerase/dehydratase family protein [Anaerolineales bacterium]